MLQKIVQKLTRFYQEFYDLVPPEKRNPPEDPTEWHRWGAPFPHVPKAIDGRRVTGIGHTTYRRWRNGKWEWMIDDTVMPWEHRR